MGKALVFSFSKDLLSKAAKWILDDKVAIGSDELKCQLTPDQKYIVVKRYSASTDFTAEEKKALADKIFSKDNSD